MPIVTDPEILRRPCEPVRSVQEGQEIARKLQAELLKYNKKAKKAYRKDGGKNKVLVLGLGLAAPQIGIAKKVCVICVGEQTVALLNPVIVARSEATIPFTEGCLSLPDVQVEVRRNIWVEVHTLNLKPRTFGPQDPGGYTAGNILLSVVAQHEIDHLLSVLITDYARKGAA